MCVISLDAPEAHNSRVVGSKAARLAQLRGLGLATPPGFVITAPAFGKFLAGATNEIPIYELLKLEGSDLEKYLDQAIRRVEDTRWQPQLREAITAAYRTLNSPVAVRSSGLVEDSSSSAFAGAYASFLNCSGEAEVLAAVRNCWRSAFSQRVVTYRTQHHLLGFDWLMGVIIQKMVVAERAGVMFTRNPFDKGNTLLIEMVRGGCDKIVRGEPADLSLWVDRISRKPHHIEALPAPEYFGTTASSFLASHKRRSPKLLSTAELENLVDVGLQLETKLGGPVDLEWAIADEELMLLQARPLTAYTSA
jgi:pyruvate,water dikinase